ncbi:HAD-IC family P-type ATPase [Wenzhouxiangella sp. XN201]|uniref:cation-translocating P-type ATPase n=1 Tax=Wenzhouxiangella sp. XN201 TaxID=2710755 RepID=UPI0013CC8F6F|nr:HAD-IC family P-type ATPase [Wenzhouxiangella sp. XN201]NEZ03461.1 HAD-IC family P-type ATPase [Wenzhouxiangella sp. XN201]
MKPWHTLTPAESLEGLQSSSPGLTAEEAARRLAKDGPNALPESPRRPWWRRLLAQFHNVLIYVLIAAALLAATLAHWVDAGVITAVVIINAIIGLAQEGKAERAMEAIGRMLALKAKVRRDGRWQTIPAAELVRGDIVRLGAGDLVPADLRLLESHGLRIDQAALTGESVPVGKTVETVEAQAPLADRRCLAYSGTLVGGGQGTGVVFASGSDTELGRISSMLETVENVTTPLLRQVNRFGQILSAVLVGFTVLVITLGRVLHGLPLDEGFLAGVALIVAAIPEGLPAIITITLAVGVQRMAARQAIIRRLPAVETLGSVTTICSDKTGTLTRNELHVRRVLTGMGDFSPESLPADCDAVRALAEAAVLCNDAEFGGDSNDPIELALLDLAAPAAIKIDEVRHASPRTALLPFSSHRKLMATAHGERLIIKGAPETVLERCSHVLGADGMEQLLADTWRTRLDDLAGDGLRILALAERHAGTPIDSIDDEHTLGKDFCLLGLVGFADPPRAEVPQSIRACREAGIRVKMITGDHAVTAGSIARELGLTSGNTVLTGPELDRLDDAELAERSASVDVYARTSPEHKLRLVTALQARGEVVAMTGDGANDAPALKRADIGVAMGIKGTEASRQAAEMVLADDNFSTIAAGIEEGRGVYDNIRKAVLFILPTNAAEALVVALAVLAGVTLPITPVQILWINMATAVTLALALAFEPTEGDVMRRPPRPRSEGLITGFVAARILWVGLVLTGATFALFQWSVTGSGDEALARTLAVNLLVAGEIVYLFNCRRLFAPSLTRESLGANRWAWLMVAILVVMQLGFTYLPAAQLIFGTTALEAGHWLLIGALVVPLLLAVELEKWLWRRFTADGGDDRPEVSA